MALWISVSLSIIASLFLFISTRVFDISILGKWIDSLVLYIAIPLLFGIYMIIALCQDIFKPRRKQPMENIGCKLTPATTYETTNNDNSLNPAQLHTDSNEATLNEKIDTELKKSEIIRNQKLEDKITKAIDYTIDILAPYTTDSQMEKLITYIRKFDLKDMDAIHIEEGINMRDLKVPDICNFMWGLMQIFEFGRGLEQKIFAAEFTKRVFPEITSNTQISTIRSKFRSEANFIKIAPVEEYLGINA